MSDAQSSPTVAALRPDAVAVVTGAASGIGRAACRKFAGLGLRIVLADLAGPKLDAARDEIAGIAGDPARVLAHPTDVADETSMAALKTAVGGAFGTVDVLMNNAAIRPDGRIWDDPANWRSVMEVNFWGVANGVRAFVPDMIAAGQSDGQPRLVITTGSKQGITNPPSNAAYNMTKAALKSYAESLEHELRGTEGAHVTSHLLIPGWTTTGDREHRPGAWLPEQVIDWMVPALANGDFYILCPDNEVTPEMDAKRVLWGAGDIVKNRPPLSRWHADHKDVAAKACS